MRRHEVVKRIVGKTGIETADVDLIVKACFEVIKDEVGKGKRIDFREFGCFLPRKRKAKKGRDIARGRTIEIPARIEPHFKPSKKCFTINQSVECTT
ncbi:MAG TPA: HU family DNA-binding protein [Chryseolinea sp.]|nr:HU family DNA-binding protein [Chryseolinea sp.]